MSSTWLAILAVLFIFSSSVLSISCPTLPSTCVCQSESSNRLSIYCDGVSLPSLFKDIGSLPLERLRIERCSQSTIDHLPNTFIRSLELSSCNIENIQPKVFRNVESSLEELILSNNSLKTIPLFGRLNKLVALNLNQNLLSDIPEKALEGLVQLRQLRVENNHICALSPNSLNETKGTLELLDLSGNCLAAIPAQNLRNSIKLMYLDLSDNKISEINNFELMNLPQLKELRLNNNLLNKINAMAWMNVPNLQYLYMKDNLVGSLDGNRLQAFKNLEILDVTNNMLQKLPALKDLTNLKQVRMDGNLIEKIETLAFSNNPKLQLISLQNNNIEQISRNSFDALDQLVILLLSNNSIRHIERGMLDGMRNLQQLNMRNNSLNSMDANTFSSLKQLTTLDLAHNDIRSIPQSTFTHQSKLFWLDLSNNQLSTFQKGTFDKKISNILLDGNKLICDEAFDWFVNYLVVNRVRTFLSFQPEITCAGPAKYAGVRLKDLMIKKANDTLSEGIKTLGLNNDNNQKSLLSSFIPNLGGPLGGFNGNAAAGVPILNTITQAIPSLRSIPGLSGNAATGTGAQNVPMNRNLNSAIEQFTAPLVRFATGGQPVASDIEQLIQSIPNFVVNVPGLGNVDIAKLDPNLVAHVLKGGQIPGIPKETLDSILHQYMIKMHEAAAAARDGKKVEDANKYLPPLNKLPQDMVTSVLQGENLPGLNQSQTQVIKEYYTQAMPIAGEGKDSSSGSAPSLPPITSQTMELLKLLPSGYDISKIPADIITAVSRGEIPDMTKLPADLIEYFKTNTDKMAGLFNRASAANNSIEEMLAKLPKFEKPDLATFSPYDINVLSNDMIHEEEEAKKAAKIRVYTAIALGLVGAITVVVLAVFVIYIKKQRALKIRHPLMNNGHTIPGAPLANSTMRDGRVIPPIQSSQLHLPVV